VTSRLSTWRRAYALLGPHDGPWVPGVSGNEPDPSRALSAAGSHRPPPVGDPRRRVRHDHHELAGAAQRALAGPCAWVGPRLHEHRRGWFARDRAGGERPVFSAGHDLRELATLDLSGGGPWRRCGVSPVSSVWSWPAWEA